jgi:DNA-binding NarL/FixJ family response regulator
MPSNTDTLRLLVMDPQPIIHAGIRAFIDSDPVLAAKIQVSTTGSLEAGLAELYTMPPDLILLDSHLPINSAIPTPANLFQAVTALQQFGDQAILLMVTPPAALDPALILARKQQVTGLVSKTDLSSPPRLHEALQAVCSGHSYVSVGRARHLMDLMAGREFFTLTPAQMRLIETLNRCGTVEQVCLTLGAKLKTTYRHLKTLSDLFGVARWQAIPARAHELGLLCQGRMICDCGIRVLPKSPTYSAAAQPYAWSGG